jgi:PleD family two-component response regulator
MDQAEAPKKVLVVDDDKLLRDSLAEALAEHGYLVSQAADGEEALAAAEKNVPDVLITDVMMPKLDGIGLLQKLRHTTWGANIPAIVLTIKDADVEDVNRAMETHTVAYLSKAEMSPQQIVTLVDQQLQKQD